MTQRPQIVRAAAVGFAAGLAGAYAMELWQTGATKLKTAAGVGESSGEASTEKAADAVSQAARGRPVSEHGKTAAGRRAHYLAGAALGTAYGVGAELWPDAATGFGAGLGLASLVVLDETLVPVLGLGAPPQKTSPLDHLYGAFAHLVYGVATEAARRVLGGARDPVR